jgi:hypothetical protein
MKQPSSADYLFGNSFSYVVLSLAVIVSFLGVFGGAVSPVVPIALLAIGYYAHSAHERIRKYKAWKSEWDAMGGQPQPPPLRPSDRLSRGLKRNPALRYFLGFVAWGLLALMSTAGGGGVRILFWLGTILLVINAIVRYRRRGREQAKPADAASVMVCVPLPRQSASAAQAFAGLPQYCLPLFGLPAN